MLSDEPAFMDRKDAGIVLGKNLACKYTENVLILGIPRGGVEVAYYVAQALNAPLSLIVSKKLPYPGQPEYGFGAVAEEDIIYVTEKYASKLPDDLILDIINLQKKEIERRIKLYRNGSLLPDLKGKTVIVVDDGIATGVTLAPCIRLCRKKGATKVVIAAPVSGMLYDPHLAEADQIEILVKPPRFFSVSQVYEEFENITDEDVLELLERAKSLKNQL